MSASLEKYGLDGKALYDAWEHELEELVNKHRINPDPVADEQQLHTLKQKLHTSRRRTPRSRPGSEAHSTSAWLSQSCPR